MPTPVLRERQRRTITRTRTVRPSTRIQTVRQRRNRTRAQRATARAIQRRARRPTLTESAEKCVHDERCNNQECIITGRKMSKRNPGIQTAAGKCYSARAIAEYYKDGNEANRWRLRDPQRIPFEPSDIDKIEACVEKYFPHIDSIPPENGLWWEEHGMISPERYAWLQQHLGNLTPAQQEEWNRANGL